MYLNVLASLVSNLVAVSSEHEGILVWRTKHPLDTIVKCDKITSSYYRIWGIWTHYRYIIYLEGSLQVKVVLRR